MRHQVYHSLDRSADALFDLTDALLCEAPARSLPELSLSATFRRTWSSCYEALEDGCINQGRWSRIWTTALFEQQEGAVWISIDSTSIARPETALAYRCPLALFSLVRDRT